MPRDLLAEALPTATSTSQTFHAVGRRKDSKLAAIAAMQSIDIDLLHAISHPYMHAMASKEFDLCFVIFSGVNISDKPQSQKPSRQDIAFEDAWHPKKAPGMLATTP